LDHPGVPNFTLVKEEAEVARTYDNKSVAEQNSVDIAWNLLMGSKYNDLRAAICGTESELKHFRQLVVNVVLSTDIFDKDLKALREARWEKAFAEENCVSKADNANRRATIVMEHVIQASDVSHTMQHWTIYEKWNQRLFQEMMAGYKAGRLDKDPSLGWYEGELWFFDNYIIPLAKKLKECGVFGVSSDEFLNYALDNRQEWQHKGKDLVKSWVEEMDGGLGESISSFEEPDNDSNTNNGATDSKTTGFGVVDC
jgi:hypothetical protein